jgi:glycosyltransferase involved in cell wall biosynthesis
LRVLATVEKYAPAIGGAERVVQRVAEGLAARGHDVHVLTGGPRDDVQLGGVSVHRLPLSGNESRGIRGERASVGALIDRVQPDVLFNYAAQTWTTDCCFAWLERPRPFRMVLAPCGFSGLGSRRYAKYFEAMPERLRRYDALILHSSVYQDWRFASDARVEQMFVVPNGADPPEPADGRPPPHSGSRAVTVGSHVIGKGHAQFANAVRALAREREITGTIVAPPRRGLEAVRGCQLACRARALTGPVELLDGSRPGVATGAIAAADVFLFTSRLECAPLVIIEAMAAGTPWVSFDVGNVSELAGGIVAADEAALLTASRQILDGQRPHLGHEGRKAWEADHRWGDIVARYESIFEEVLAAPVSSSA